MNQKQKYQYYWDKASEEIWKILEKNIKKEDRICEVGCAGGHFLAKLYEEDYKNLSGVEIREDEIKRTEQDFVTQGIIVKFINKNVLDVQEKYDVVFTTGLLQCFKESARATLMQHLSKMAKKTIIVVPEICEDRNDSSEQAVAVDGCEEFITGNFEWELSKYYSVVRSGKLNKEKIGLKDNFLYFVCEMAGE